MTIFGIEGRDPFCYNPRMKGRLYMPSIFRFGTLLAILAVLAGCARSPSGVTPPTVRKMSFEITFAGPINDAYHYFVVLDTAGGITGPTPLFPGVLPGTEGWVIAPATHYIEYTGGQYMAYRITSLDPPLPPEFADVLLSPTRPEPGSASLSFTISLDEIGATGDSLNVNVIAIHDPSAPIRLIDGLGLRGMDFVHIDITRPDDPDDTRLGDIEGTNDVLDQNQQQVPGQPTEQTKPLDIDYWAITIDV